MFSETDGSRKAIGDVDILFHEGLYHLFHLVLPNHDFIAHAVSTDGIHWRRVRNAVFIGDPGSWDDLMLWTMHVSKDPHRPGGWRMFYTGLSRRDRGQYQRVGLALSQNLYQWEKYPVNWKDKRGADDPELVKAARVASARQGHNDTTAQFDQNSCFPISPSPEHYEADLEEGRQLISFRDPYFHVCDDGNFLLVAARVKDGPIVRRGCVAKLEEVEPYQFVSQKPLHWPMLYDDVEVPNLLEIEGQLYLIGSIREDAKIRYWHAKSIDSKWCSYHDNVLMPQGNYAGRICRDEKGWLLWCFFAMNRHDRTDNNLLPPPKRLFRDEDGLLRVKTFEELAAWKAQPVDIRRVKFLKDSSGHDYCRVGESNWEISSECGFQAFVFEDEMNHFWLSGKLILNGKGKCGLVFRVDPENHDGYYLSLDFLKGVAQLRAWGTDRDQVGENMMSFETLQTAFWYSSTPGQAEICLVCFGSYIELSIDGNIVLSLADRQFTKGNVGLYLDTAKLEVRGMELCHMKIPEQIDDQLVRGKEERPLHSP